LKSKATNIKKSPYVNGSGGIYIRKNYLERLASGEIPFDKDSSWTQIDAQMLLMQHKFKRSTSGITLHNLLQHFEFFSNSDAKDNNLFHRQEDLFSMLYDAYADPSVVAFNTRGDFKHTITQLVHMQGAPEEGLYIKKRYLTSLSSSLAPIRQRTRYTLDTFFDKIFVINVASSTERWNKMVDMLRANNITNYERVEAVTPQTAAKFGWKWPTSHKNRNGISHSSMGVQLAIKLSNWLCMCLAKERNYNRFLILEDDAAVVEGTLDRFPEVSASLEQSCPDWDIFYLFAKHHRDHRKIDDNITKLEHSLTTTAYALSRRRLDYIIEQVALNHSQPVDDILCNIVAPHVNVYQSNPMIFHPDETLVSHVPIERKEPRVRRVKMICNW
jgi:GR25 family glycosyltransferase involved in LPS biosynthesis